MESQEIKPGDQSIYKENETFYDVLGAGKVKIPLPNEKSLHLEDVFFAPSTRGSVISVSQLAFIGFEIRFRHKKVTFGLNEKVGFTSSLS